MIEDRGHWAAGEVDPRSPVAAQSAPATHELVAAFAHCGLPLHRILVEMLGEHHSHQTERRGCGYTQATRFLADLINRTGAPQSAMLGVFDERCEGIPSATLLRQAALQERMSAMLEQLAAQLKFPESRLLLTIIEDLCDPRRSARAESSALPVSDEKLKVGSCPLAEQFFLEIAHGRIRRGGRVNVLVDSAGQACLLEKRGLGDEHSCISLRTIEFAGVRLPRGSLFAIDYDEQQLDTLPQLRGINGRRMRAGMLHGARFLRLTTLAVDPVDRKRAFTTHFKQQIDGGLFSPDTTTIEQLDELARNSLP